MAQGGMLLQWLLIINGLYGVYCAYNILWCDDMVSTLHTAVWNRGLHYATKRMLGYWMGTYGTVRLYAGAFNMPGLGALTYILEALCFEYEKKFHTLEFFRAWIVCMSCYCLACYSLAWSIRGKSNALTRHALPGPAAAFEADARDSRGLRGG